MKELILVRHGKSSWDYNVDDINRPLQERGIMDAPRVAKAFLSDASDIDAVFSSPANRALHTCIMMMRQLGLPFDKLLITKELYDFSGGSAMDFVHHLDNTYRKVMIFGHNHAFTHIANSWGNSFIDNVPTTGLVHIQFSVDSWGDVHSGVTKRILIPKSLR